MQSRLLLAALALSASAALAAGCGDEGAGGSKVAELAPPGTPIFAEVVLRPSGELKADADAVAERVAGVESLGELVVTELERSAREDGEPFEFESEVEPWLGEHGAAFWDSGDTDESNLIVETTDAAATREFVDKQVERSKVPYESRSYAGVDYEFGGADRSAVGVVGEFLVATDGERRFKRVVDASAGDSLAAEAGFSEAIGAASKGSLADVYVDVGKLIEQSGDEIDPLVGQVLGGAGIDPREAKLTASVVPAADRVAVEFSSDLAGEEAPTGDAAELFGSLPGDAFAALAVSGFGKQAQEALDGLDDEGVPGAVPQGRLKSELKKLGIDLDALTGSLRDAGLFAVGEGESSLGGALVLTTEGEGAVEAVSNIGKALRSFDLPGVAALGGRYSGFSVRSDDLGEKPLVVAARPGRVAIGYGTGPTVSALASGSGGAGTLAENPAYDDAVAALGETPIGGFADGPAALRLADSLIPASDEDFEQAKKYLRSIRFLALGAAAQDDLATAKLIVGLK